GFLAQQFGDQAADGMVEIFRDPEMGFVVLAYNMDAPRVSPPHDHGRSWAAYGQVAAHTDMTVWSAAATRARLATPNSQWPSNIA
ncbi:MAG: hypothetical protein VX784_04280, partial [Pseudomonadota bacterium]|nr:hypothetical protein [Pseudomonadota bacterium]